MRSTGVVFGTLLFAATAALSPARADGERNWWFETEGAFDFWDGDRNIIGDGTGKLGPDNGFSLLGEIGHTLGDGVQSLSLAVKYGESGRNDGRSNSSFDGTTIFAGADVDSDERIYRVDATYRRMLEQGAGLGIDAQLIAGIRFLDFKSQNKGVIVDQLFGVNGPDKVDRTFIGAGPRIGIETETPISEQAIFEFDVAGALLIGERKFQKDATAFQSNGTFIGQDLTSRTKTKVIPNIEAFAGVTWQMPDSAVRLTGGYAVDAYFGLLDAGCSCFFEKGNRFFHGPRLKARIPF